MSLSGTESQTSLNSRLDGISIGGDTVLASAFSVDCRMGSAKERVIIGDACALECTITLEREVGTVSIGDHTFIGRSHLVCAHRVEIGSNILIAWGCTIMDHDSHSLDWERRAGDIDRWREGLASGQSAAAAAKEWSSVACAPVRIGDKAWLGFRTIVLKGVTIGEGAVVGAGSVVARDVPPWTVVAGNPARVIKRVPSSDR